MFKIKTAALLVKRLDAFCKLGKTVELLILYSPYGSKWFQKFVIRLSSFSSMRLVPPDLVPSIYSYSEYLESLVDTNRSNYIFIIK